MDSLLRWREPVAPPATEPEQAQGDGRSPNRGDAGPGRAAASVAPLDVTGAYSASLGEYCATGGESALSRAFHLGHQAAGDGLGVLALAVMHQQALAVVLSETRTVDETARIAQRAGDFLAEALTAFDEKHRRCEEEHSTLYELNQGLEQWLNATQHQLDAAQALLLERSNGEQRKDEFIRAINRVTCGSLSVLQSGLGGELNSHGHRLLDTAVRNCERVMRLLGDSLAEPKRESGG